MWEISIVTVVALATLLFLLRNQLRKLAIGNNEQYQYEGERSPANPHCQNTESTLPGHFRGCAIPSLEKNASSVSFNSIQNSGSAKALSARSLLSMEPGRKGTVLALTGGREFEAKLVSMGFNVGSEVTILKSGVGGSGLLVATGDTRLAIGNGIAERIVVAVDSIDDTTS